MVSRRTLLLGAAGLAAGSSLTALSACARIPQDYEGVQPLGQRTFADYVLETRAWIAAHREFVTDDHAEEMAYNAPSETCPAV